MVGASFLPVEYKSLPSSTCLSFESSCHSKSFKFIIATLGHTWRATRFLSSNLPHTPRLFRHHYQGVQDLLSGNNINFTRSSSKIDSDRMVAPSIATHPSMATQMKAMAHFRRPNVEIVLHGQEGAAFSTYTTLDEIKGEVLLTAQSDCRFDDISITLEGISISKQRKGATILFLPFLLSRSSN
jgi:hypothetical protein